MDMNKTSYAALGMLFGTVVGGGLATVLYASSGDAIYCVIAGLGTAVGLLIGAGMDRARGRMAGQDRQND